MKDFFLICILGCLLAISVGALFSGAIFISIVTIAIQVFIVKKIINPSRVISNEKFTDKKISKPKKTSVNFVEIDNSEKYIAKELSSAHLVRFNKIKVVGVSFDNEDGSSRQLILSGLRYNDEVIIKKNPSEEYPTRISVYTSDFRCIGSLSAEMSKLLQYFDFNHAVGRLNSAGKGDNGLFWGTINFDIQLENHDKIEQSEDKTELLQVVDKYPPILFYYFFDLFDKHIKSDDLVFAQHKNLGTLKVDMQSLCDFYTENSARPKYIAMKSSNSCEFRKFSFDCSFFKDYFQCIIIERSKLASGIVAFPLFNIGKAVLKDFGMDEDGKKPRPVYVSPEELYELERENYIPDDIYDDGSDYWMYEEPESYSKSSNYWSDD